MAVQQQYQNSSITTEIPILSYSKAILSFWSKFFPMGDQNLSNACAANCSGHGECLQGTCWCQVQYDGVSCLEPNVAYFVWFATVFYLVAVVSFMQLLLCIICEYRKLKTPSVRMALGLTTQKLLYGVTCIAATLRGAYFSSPTHADLPLSATFMSAFYPIILTAGSLIVCFWAEAFHLNGIRCESARFLSKSTVGFVCFNVITYSLFAMELYLLADSPDSEYKSYLSHIFNLCYAVLIFIVVIFFLIYGVEVYFKVRGGFVSDSLLMSNVVSRAQVKVAQHEVGEECCVEDKQKVADDPLLGKEEHHVETAEGEESKTNFLCCSRLRQNQTKKEPCLRDQTNVSASNRGVDSSQLHQSRFGLVFQACMLMITVCFLCSDVMGAFWKSKVPLMSRNVFDILFRVVELGVALWFPCVLWNCMAPEQLWILNPKKILKKIDLDTSQLTHIQDNKDGISMSSECGDCWICYDSDRTDVGPLIRPCDCRGDVGTVHHHCLRKWLVECVEGLGMSDRLCCKVCGVPYILEQPQVWWIGKGLTARKLLFTALLVTVMCACVAALWTALQLASDTRLRALAAGAAILVIYVCLRLLGFSAVTVYQRAKVSAVRILGDGFAKVSSTGNTAQYQNDAQHSLISTINTEVTLHIANTNAESLPHSNI